MLKRGPYKVPIFTSKGPFQELAALVKGVCPGRWTNQLMNVYGILYMLMVMQNRQRMAAVALAIH